MHRCHLTTIGQGGGRRLPLVVVDSSGVADEGLLRRPLPHGCALSDLASARRMAPISPGAAVLPPLLIELCVCVRPAVVSPV